MSSKSDVPDPEKLSLPITQDKCPFCGCEGGIIKEILKRLVDQGKINENSFPDGVMIPFPLIDPARPPSNLTAATTMKVYVLKIFLEQCMKCKKTYYPKVDLAIQEIPVQFQQMKK